MSSFIPAKPDPKLDLVLERVVDVPPELVWEAWTTPEHIKQWFTPKPWKTIECEIELRVGGIFRTVMQSPDGQVMDGGAGCYLDVVPGKRLVWTSALGPGFRPVASSDGDPVGAFTAIIAMESDGKGGTRYTATAIHKDETSRKQHEEMGFHEGWGTAFDQLVELMREKMK